MALYKFRIINKLLTFPFPFRYRFAYNCPSAKPSFNGACDLACTERRI